MAKMSWNDFITTHPKHATFGAIVSASLPNGLIFDKRKKKLPTPYGLFVEWASANLTGDWAAMKVRGSFCISVSQQSDAKIISNKFGVTSQAKKTTTGGMNFGINYRDSDYAVLARSLGYEI
ncbi:hypothetical protein SGN30_17945 [Delftia acidovorans]|uniref:Uncharacterized protein n=1 Tax=Delftia acidovorans TaxID=80866 RepID=A0AAJ2R3S7_DELAC|nr:hypothetical protein [Delftia acidovorans]